MATDDAIGVSVVIIHSSSMDDDKSLLMRILPPRFLVDAQQLDATAVSLSDGLCTILILPTTSPTTTTAPGSARAENGSSGRNDRNPPPSRTPTPTMVTPTSFATIIVTEGEIQAMADQASRNGLSVDEVKFVGTAMVKFTLPGGCLLTLATVSSWQNATIRGKVIEFLVGNSIPPGGMRATCNQQQEDTTMAAPFLTPQSKRGGSIPADSDQLINLRRSMSLPEMIPPLATTNRGPASPPQPSQNRIFPTLRTLVLSRDGQYIPFPLNSQTPIPIETDLFVGRLLLVMRPINPHDDPYWNERIFSKKKRRVIMQLQGRFKYKPKGTIFAGMEISDPMNLGLIASGLCNIILKMTKSFNPALHYSFGEANKEKAHICFPASTFFEQLVVTPPGQVPPLMGTEFDEPVEVAQLRKAYKTKIDWNTDDTYSMSFHSMYVDFPSWSIVRLPIGRDISLQTFWGNASASVVMYELDDSIKEQKRHTLTGKTYLLGVEMKYLGNKDSEMDQHLEGDRVSDAGTDWSEELIDLEAGSTSTTGDAGMMPVFDEDDELHFFDTVESQSMFADDDGSASALSMGVMERLTSTSPYSSVLSVIDTFCPCWIEMFARKGRYVTLFAFCGSPQRDRPLLRTVEMAEEAFGERQLVEVDDRFSTRMSADERTRRILGLKYAEAYVDNKKRSGLARFEKVVTRFDAKFLQRNDVAPKSLNGIKFGFVARALSDRHWREERIVLRDGEILFHHLEKSAAHFRISVSSVVQVSIPDASSLPPLPSFYYLNVETFGRVTYLMFHSDEERGSWMNTLTGLMKHRHPSSSSFTNHLFEVDDPMHEFLHNSSMWDLHKRRILNCRQYSFRTPQSNEQPDTLQLAERALRMALSLQPKGPNDADLRAFLDCAAALKEADAYSLNEDERLAFFLNIYHVMIMHAYIVLGPPDSSLKWMSYFTTISYQCSDDVFSLAELEHNIIRASMSYPSQFLSRFILPKSHYHFALARPDIRINFALNPGSLSMPSGAVPVYRADLLSQQLDRTSRGFLESTVSVRQRSSRDVYIVLPRICQWFAEDFGPSGNASDILIAIESYISEEKRKALRVIWNSKRNCYDIGIFNLKYLSYNFECRFLMLDEEPT